MGKGLYWDRLAGTIARAVACGARQETLTRFSWDASRGCDSPKTIELYARPSGRRVTSWWGSIPPAAKQELLAEGPPYLLYMLYAQRARRDRIVGTERTVTMRRGITKTPLQFVLEVPCRRCRRCRFRRSKMWEHRAAYEVSEARIRGCRTWFGTLTLRPGDYYLARCRAEAEYQAQTGCDLSDCYDRETGECFDQVLIEREEYRGVRLFLMRLRKGGGKFRYLCVAEHHKSGVPHWHILIHETDRDAPIREATLSAQWIHGFSKWRIVQMDDDAGDASVRYVCKYVAKDARLRVRASENYGMSVQLDASQLPATERMGSREPARGDASGEEGFPAKPPSGVA